LLARHDAPDYDFRHRSRGSLLLAFPNRKVIKIVFDINHERQVEWLMKEFVNQHVHDGLYGDRMMTTKRLMTGS
jgi:hypothetical protein